MSETGDEMNQLNSQGADGGYPNVAVLQSNVGNLIRVGWMLREFDEDGGLRGRIADGLWVVVALQPWYYGSVWAVEATLVNKQRPTSGMEIWEDVYHLPLSKVAITEDNKLIYFARFAESIVASQESPEPNGTFLASPEIAVEVRQRNADDSDHWDEWLVDPVSWTHNFKFHWNI